MTIAGEHSAVEDAEDGVIGNISGNVGDTMPSSARRGDNSGVASKEGTDTEREKATCDSAMRKKLLHTAYLFLAFMSLGMVVAVNGPTFLDLVMILDTDIETGSVLFTSCSIGYITGSLIGGVMYDKFSKELTLFFSTLLMGIVTALVPWCKTLALMSIANVCRGIMQGILDTDGNAMMFYIWGKRAGPYVQAIHFAFGFGAIVSPLVAQPYLVEKPEVEGSSTGNNSVTNTYPFPQLNATLLYPDFNDMSTTEDFLMASEQSLINGTDGLNFTRGIDPKTGVQSFVYIPYLILGAFSALTAFSFLEMYLSSRHEMKNKADVKETALQAEEVRHIPLTLVVRVTFFVFIGMFYVSYTCVANTFTGFVMAFVVQHLKWSKTNGTLLTSVYWIAFSVGRLLAIVIAKFLSPWKMLLLDFVIFNGGFFALFLGVETSTILCWVATAGAAAAMGSIFASGMTWIDEKIFHITGRVSSFVLVSASVGMMINPLLVGYLFETYTPMWFIYLLFAETLFCTLVFLLMTALVYWVKKKWKARTLREREKDSRPRNPVTNQTFIVESTDL